MRNFGAVTLHCFGTYNTRNRLNRSRHCPYRARLVPLILHMTLKRTRDTGVFNSSCTAPSNAYVHSCVRIDSLTSTRLHTLRSNGANTIGLNANENFSIHRIIRDTHHIANRRVPTVIAPHHNNSPSGLITGINLTRRLLN